MSVDELAEAGSLDSSGSIHQACFPDVVSQEQQKAEGVNKVLSSWSNGALHWFLPRHPTVTLICKWSYNSFKRQHHSASISDCCTRLIHLCLYVYVVILPL